MRHVYRGRSRHLHGRGARLMAAYDGVLVEIAGGVGTVTLNRPEKLNAFDRALCDELTDALRMLAQSDGVRAIVIAGAGRAFCAGADLAVLEADGPALVAAGKDVALAIRGAPQPVLAVVNGDRKSTRLNSSHGYISYAVFCLKKKKRDGTLLSHLLREGLLSI